MGRRGGLLALLAWVAGSAAHGQEIAFKSAATEVPAVQSSVEVQNAPVPQPEVDPAQKQAATLEELSKSVEALSKNLTVVTGDEQFKLVLGGSLAADFYYNHARPVAPGIPF